MKIIIRRNDLFMEATCVVCGQEFPPDIIVASAYNDEGNQSFGDVCPRCIHSGAEAIQAAMQGQIEQLRQRANRLIETADELEAEIGPTIDLPSWSLWRRTHLQTFLKQIGMFDDERVRQFRQSVQTWNEASLNQFLQQEVAAPEEDDPYRQACYAVAWHERERWQDE